MTRDHVLGSLGLVGEVKAGYILDSGGANSLFTGLDFLYDREFGEYLDFRRTTTGSDSTYIFLEGDGSRRNLSPAGSTFETYYFLGNRFRLADHEFFDASFAPGVALTNFPNEFYWLPVTRVTMTYSNHKVWCSLSIEDLGLLNVGVGLGLGVRL